MAASDQSQIWTGLLIIFSTVHGSGSFSPSMLNFMFFVLLCSNLFSLQLVLLILSSVPLFSSCLISFHVCWFWCRVFSVQLRSPVSKSPFPFVCLSGVFVLCPVSSWFPLCHLLCVFSLAVMLCVLVS